MEAELEFEGWFIRFSHEEKMMEQCGKTWSRAGEKVQCLMRMSRRRSTQGLQVKGVPGYGMTDEN